MAIVTLAEAKAYIGNPDADDALVTSLIPRAQSAIEVFCDRSFDSATYTERYDGSGEYELALNQWPITTVTYLSVGVEDALKIKNTSSDAYHAYVTVDSTNMMCGISGGTNVGTDTLVLATYTLATLDNAIIALGKNWTASIVTSAFGVWDSTEILAVTGLGCLDGYCYVQVPAQPEREYVVHSNRGVLYRPFTFPAGTQNIIVKYTAGYSATTMPNDLKQICIDLITSVYASRKHDSSVKSERLGDHSIAYKEDSAISIDDDMKRRLVGYKKPRQP